MKHLRHIHKGLEGSTIVTLEDVRQHVKSRKILKDTPLELKVVFMSFGDASVYSTEGQIVSSNLPFSVLKESTRFAYKNETKLFKKYKISDVFEDYLP